MRQLKLLHLFQHLKSIHNRHNYVKQYGGQPVLLLHDKLHGLLSVFSF